MEKLRLKSSEDIIRNHAAVVKLYLYVMGPSY